MSFWTTGTLLLTPGGGLAQTPEAGKRNRQRQQTTLTSSTVKPWGNLQGLCFPSIALYIFTVVVVVAVVAVVAVGKEKSFVHFSTVPAFTAARNGLLKSHIGFPNRLFIYYNFFWRWNCSSSSSSFCPASVMSHCFDITKPVTLFGCCLWGRGGESSAASGQGWN